MKTRFKSDKGRGKETVLSSTRMSALPFPVKHGCTSEGEYESTAVFIKNDQADFLFFGDLEGSSEYEKIWDEAATSWKEGRLSGIFVSINPSSDTYDIIISARTGRLNALMIPQDPEISCSATCHLPIYWLNCNTSQSE